MFSGFRVFPSCERSHRAGETLKYSRCRCGISRVMTVLQRLNRPFSIPIFLLRLVNRGTSPLQDLHYPRFSILQRKEEEKERPWLRGCRNTRAATLDKCAPDAGPFLPPTGPPLPTLSPPASRIIARNLRFDIESLPQDRCLDPFPSFSSFFSYLGHCINLFPRSRSLSLSFSPFTGAE